MEALPMPNHHPVDRNAQRERIRQRNEPPHLSLLEEIINAASHGLGVLLATAGLVLLLLKSHTPLAITASCFYGISMILMMLMSALYHAVPLSAVKRLLRRFDYASIYLLIGGTFAPILLVYLQTPFTISLFCLQWSVIAFGIALLVLFGPGKWRPLHFTLYFFIGWSGLIFLPYFFHHNPPLLAFILAGGILYTFGMIPFAQNRRFSHCIWHAFVLAAAVLHWIGIFFFIY